MRRLIGVKSSRDVSRHAISRMNARHHTSAFSSSAFASSSFPSPLAVSAAAVTSSTSACSFTTCHGMQQRRELVSEEPAAFPFIKQWTRTSGCELISTAG